MLALFRYAALLCIGLYYICGATGAARAEATQALTSEQWTPPPSEPLDLHWQLLELPGHVLQLSLTPLRPLISVVERHRVDQRIYDLLTNEERTAMLLPYIDVRGSDGIGGGALFTHSNLFGAEEKLKLSGVVAGNLDYKFSASYSQAVAHLNGRRVTTKVRYEVNRDVRYFPVGGDSRVEDERAIRSDNLQALVSGELFGPVMLNLRSELKLSYRRERLSSGEKPGTPSLGADGDGVPLPPACYHTLDEQDPIFCSTIDLPELQLSFAHDSRDSFGRTRSGWLAEAELTAMRDLNGEDLSAVRGLVDVAVFFEVLPRSRIIVLSAGGGAAAPWSDDHQLPLAGYVGLGRTAHLRGYKRDRYRDRYAWWTAAEYRYPIFEIEDYGVSLSSVVFADLARAGEDLDGLFGHAPRWSAGFGFHADTPVTSVFKVQVGFSPEGMEFIFAMGDAL